MSETKVKKVNKMKVAVISLAVALVVAIGGMVGIYAASQQSVGAQFSVKYSIEDNVAVGIAACSINAYDYGDWSKFEYFQINNTTPTENNPYELGVNSENTGNLSLVGDDYEIDHVMPRIFYFFFKNLTDVSIRVVLTDNSLVEAPIMVSYAYGDYDDGYMSSYKNIFQLDENKSYYIDIPADKMFFFELAIGMNGDPNKSASYISNAENGLSFNIIQTPATTA